MLGTTSSPILMFFYFFFFFFFLPFPVLFLHSLSCWLVTRAANNLVSKGADCVPLSYIYIHTVSNIIHYRYKIVLKAKIILCFFLCYYFAYFYLFQIGKWKKSTGVSFSWLWSFNFIGFFPCHARNGMQKLRTVSLKLSLPQYLEWITKKSRF